MCGKVCVCLMENRGVSSVWKGVCVFNEGEQRGEQCVDVCVCLMENRGVSSVCGWVCV